MLLITDRENSNLNIKISWFVSFVVWVLCYRGIKVLFYSRLLKMIWTTTVDA